jgi:hypothetical protein
MSTVITRTLRVPLIWLAVAALALLALVALEHNGSAVPPITSLSNVHLSGNPTAGKPNPPNGNCGGVGNSNKTPDSKSCHISKK